MAVISYVYYDTGQRHCHYLLYGPGYNGLKKYKKTDDDRYYFVEKNWNKVVHKVNFAYVILLGLPIIILLIFLGIQMLMS